VRSVVRERQTWQWRPLGRYGSNGWECGTVLVCLTTLGVAKIFSVGE
jgi:hypothetical protein